MHPHERPLPHPPVGPNDNPELPRTPTSPLDAPAHEGGEPRPPTGPVPVHPTKLRFARGR